MRPPRRLYSWIMRRINQCIALLCFVFGVPAICCCQTGIPLQDVGGRGSPIRVSGKVTFQDASLELPEYTTYRFEGTIANVSGKAVVLTVIHVEVRGVNAPGLDTNQPSDDHFFSLKDLQPGEEERFPTREFDFGKSADYGLRHELSGGGDSQLVREDVGSDKAPVATAKVTFVQFADGSTWGDADAGRAVIAGRSGILEELTKYERVLNEQGAAAFLHAFANRETYLHFPLIAILIARCQAQPESCLIDGMHSMVQAARQHQLEMGDHWTASDVGLDRPH